MFIELHIIQNFAPSNLNRDDLNAPKECTFGGYRRARISSQCFKRAIRTSPVFSDGVGARLGIRTKLLVGDIADRLKALGHAEDGVEQVAIAALAEAGFKMDGPRTAVLLFLAPGEMQACADAVHEHYATVQAVLVGGAKPDDDQKIAAKALKSSLRALGSQVEAADIALFGRMVAENTNMNIVGACQVAHAISTHAVNTEMDFFTAVDDLQPGEETGAGMMGIVEFNSACFYRYAVVDLNQLEQNLVGDRASAIEAVLAFCEAAAAAIPTGKQNSMAAQNPPSFIGVRVRDGGQPISLANAFVNPIRVTPQEPDLIEGSITKLLNFDRGMATMLGSNGLKLAMNVSTYPEHSDASLRDAWSALKGALG